jgi:hypothetical protein
MPIPVIHQNTVLSSYCKLMEELKLRHAVVSDVVENAKNGRFVLSPAILGELCFLQLRMICELIALGCLLVHGDIPAARTNKMKKAHQADWIISRLEQLHPSFYPQPSEQILNKQGKVIELKPVTEPYLTKADLLKLHASCGPKLHRGSLKTVMDARSFDLAQVASWLTKISTLLNHHQIPSIDDNYLVVIIMRGKDDGKIHAYAATRIEGDMSP